MTVFFTKATLHSTSRFARWIGTFVLTVVLNLPALSQVIRVKTNFDSIISIVPAKIKMEKVNCENKKFNIIYYDDRENILAYGNVKNGKSGRNIKDGNWIYYNTKQNKPICKGTYKKGLKKGWWFLYPEECGVKFKHDKKVKVICKW